MSRKRAPWATWYPISGLSGGPCYGTARKQTLHTTESGDLPNWHAIRSAPHFTVNPATGEAWQHLDIGRSGYALGSPGGGRSPNMNAGLHVQWEVIGYARLTSLYDDRWYKRLAVWLQWVASEWNIPTTFPFPFGGDDGYGINGKYRQSWPTYANASGIIGHSNAPYNTHWDPGDLSQGRLRSFLGGEEVMAITDKDVQRIARRVNQTLGDYNAEGEPNKGVEKPELGARKLREIENVVRRIEKKLG